MKFLFASLVLAGSLFAQSPVVIAGGGPQTGSPALGSALSVTQSVAVDSQGRVYFASQSRVFRIEGDGTLTRIAGGAISGFSGDGGLAVNAQLRTPYGLALDSAGNLYIADYGNHRIRKVDASGVITTFAGNGGVGLSGDDNAATGAMLHYPCGMAFDASGSLYFADSGNHRIRKINTDGIISNVVGYAYGGFGGDDAAAVDAHVYFPTDVALDTQGNLFIADYGNHRVRKVDTSGKITTYAGGAAGFAGDGAEAAKAQFNSPIAISIDRNNNLYISDYLNQRIRKISSSGSVSTVAGSGTGGFKGDNGAATSADVYYPRGLASDSGGNLVIADMYNQRVRRINSSGSIATVAGNGAFQFGGDSGQALQAQMNQPSAAVMDRSGNLYIADTANHRVRKVGTDGVVSTIAGDGTAGTNGLSYPSALAVDSAGNLYIADTGNDRIRMIPAGGSITSLTITPAVRAPAGLATDAAGNLYIADTGNHRVLKRSPGGDVTTLIDSNAGLNGPYGVAVDNAGSVYVADLYNQRVVKRAVTGELSVAVDPRENGFPVGVAVDAAGTVYVAYYGKHELVKRPVGGDVVKLLGSGDLYFPQGLGWTPAGELVISDTGNHRVLKLAVNPN